MIQIVVGLLLLSLSLYCIIDGIKEQCDIKNYILKTDVKSAFKEVDWSKQTFAINNITLEDGKGHKTFYPSEEIDKAIDRLDEKL